jgi:hypothetical protein
MGIGRAVRGAVRVLMCMAPLGGLWAPPLSAREPASGFGLRPYLAAPRTDAMTIAWTSPLSTTFTLRYGQEGGIEREVTVAPTGRPFEWSVGPLRVGGTSRPASLPASAPATAVEHQYVARLEGLRPGVRCQYEVRGGGATAKGAFLPLAPPGEAFTFIAYGDSQEPEVHRRVAAGFAQWTPRLILHVGDLTDEGGYYPLWGRGFFGPLGEVAAGVPVLPAQGNHDDGALLLRLFPRSERRLYYSFDCGDAHFVCLDTLAGRVNAPKMLEWCERDLAASKARWKIVYGHFPSYDVGAHGTAWGRKDFLPLFRRCGVDLVLSGHTHTYQRWRPMFTRGENEKHPITYIVTGGGGGPLHRLSRDPDLAAGASEHHYLVLTVGPGQLCGRALTPEGKELDAFRIDKDAQGRVAPDYLAQAVAEDDWGALRALVRPCVAGLALSDDLRTGRPGKVKVDLSAGDRAMTFTLDLEDRAGGAYEMRPVSGRSPPGGAASVEVGIRLREPARWADPAVELPVLRLECVFTVDGRTASVFSNRLVWPPPGPPRSAPTTPP